MAVRWAVEKELLKAALLVELSVPRQAVAKVFPKVVHWAV